MKFELNSYALIEFELISYELYCTISSILAQQFYKEQDNFVKKKGFLYWETWVSSKGKILTHSNLFTKKGSYLSWDARLTNDVQ